ncbi:MAG: GNAT family N-acetyltransferase [Thermoproteota archaeon]
MKIEWLGAVDKNYWNNIINDWSNSEVYHLFEWAEVIQETYKVKIFRMVAEESGRVQVALPIVFFGSFLGRKLVSLPFCDYGGFCGNMNRREAISLLLKELIKISHSLVVDFIELRMLAQMGAGLSQANFYPGPTALTYRLRTDRCYDHILGHVYSANVRKDLRRAEREGLKVREASGIHDLDIYYRLYLRRMMELGTPPAPKRFWINLWNHFYPQRLKLIFTTKQGKDIAAFVALIYRKRLYLLLNVSDSRSWGSRGLNDILFDWYIRFACENGLEEVDFGRTRRGTGVMEFKEKGWGCVPLELCKYYYFLRGHKNPIDVSLQSNIYAKTWSRFVPKMAAPTLGYMIRKNIGDA